jgi:hypothetical protein
MTDKAPNHGGAPVGTLADLDAVTAAAVIYLRMWCDSPELRQSVRDDMIMTLGASRGRQALNSFDELCSIRARHGRRPMMRHAVKCKCIGADETCFANFIAVASEGNREDAMLIATLMVRPHLAAVITSLATDFGLALKQMRLAAPRKIATEQPLQTTFH